VRKLTPKEQALARARVANGLPPQLTRRTDSQFVGRRIRPSHGGRPAFNPPPVPPAEPTAEPDGPKSDQN
jgi:hypothetical protein